MKKKFKAKVSGMFDIVQLSDDTFSEVVEKLKANDYLEMITNNQRGFTLPHK